MPLPGGTTNFADVEQFEAIGVGEYEGHIEYIRFRAAASDDKSDQLSVCLVSDEDATQGEKAWQNLYFTPKSLWRMAKFFGLFGVGEIDWDNGLSGEEPFDLIDPDLSGEPVRFEVKADGTYKGKPSFKTEVTEWLGGKAAPAAKVTAPKAAEDPEVEDPEPVKKAPARSIPSAKAGKPERRPLR